MQPHKLSLPNYTFFSPNFSHCPRISTYYPPTHQPTKLVFNQTSKSGFCNSPTMLSKSPTSLRNNGGLVSVRCGVVQGDCDDGFYMRRCVEIARKAIGCTSPNPMVGCVIVKDGKIVGEGFHPKAGQPHAEVFALRDAGDLAENATAYVSLEPCNHYGRTPPCSEALIKAKVKKVVIGMVDPNPIVASKGVDRLREAGIDVTVGVEEELCRKLNEAYIHKMLSGNPFVTLRYSLSVNGHVLDQLGERAEESGGYYSVLLQEYDAVITSPASLTENFSFPASQEPGANQPRLIIIARTPNSPIQITGLTSEAKVIIFTDKETAIESEAAQKGIEIVVLDHLNLNAILEYCRQQGLCSVLLDLRGNFGNFEPLLKEGSGQNLLQKIVIEMVPFWDEVEVGNSLKSLGKRLKVENLQPKISKQSVVLEGYL